MRRRHCGPRACCALLLFAICTPALTDGFFTGQELAAGGRPSSAAQKAILIREGTEEVLLLQTTYQGPASAFAWVVPVPSRPADVFPAERYFMDGVFGHTTPRTVTEVDGRLAHATKSRMLAEEGAAKDGAAVAGEQVTVVQRLIVGDYDAAVLSATGGKALKRWLDRNGYGLPEGGQAHLEPYVRAQWFFVAVKLMEGVVARQPYLGDVSPLGIRFPVRDLVFPLRISRISAPPLSAILLCVIDDGPVTCRGMPVHWVKEDYSLARGETYGTYRRQIARGAGQARLLCEYSARRPLPFTDLSYRADGWIAPRPNDMLRRYATRFFALLATDELEDMIFERDTSAPDDYVVVVRRSGDSDENAISAWREHRPTLTHPPASTDPLLNLLEGEGTVGIVRTALAMAQAGGSAKRPARSALAFLALIVLAVLAAVLGWMILRRRRGAVLPILLMMGAIAGAATVAASGGGGHFGSLLVGVLNLLDDSATAFQQDTGCYPRRVEDLVATKPPPVGLDASGNEVPLGGKFRGPYLSALPGDPIKGRGLVCDPLALRLIDSGGFKSTVTCETPQKALEMTGERYERPEGYAFWMRRRPNRGLDPYADWLSKRSPTDLVWVATRPELWEDRHIIGPCPMYYGSGLVFVADMASGEGWALRDYGHSSHICSMMPNTGFLLSTYEVSWGVGLIPSGEGLSTVALLPGHAGLPSFFAGRPIEGAVVHGVPAPNGKLVAVLVRRYTQRDLSYDIYLIEEAGTPRGPLANGLVFGMEFSPDSQHLYVVGALDDRFQSFRRDAETGASQPGHGERDDWYYPDYDLVRMSAQTGRTETIMQGVDWGVLDADAKGVLILRSGRELGVIGYDGRWTKVGALPDGERVVSAALFGDVAVAAFEPEMPEDTGPLGLTRLVRFPLAGGGPEQICEVRRWEARRVFIIIGARDGNVSFVQGLHSPNPPYQIITAGPNKEFSSLELVDLTRL